MTDHNERIAAALRGFKAEAKLSVRVLVKRTGIPTATLNRSLNGERGITVTQMVVLADAMGVTPMQVMRRAEEMSNSSPLS